MTKKNQDRKVGKEQTKTNKNTIIVAAIFVCLIGYYAFVQFSEGAGNYPGLIEGVFYLEPVVSTDGGKVTVPKEFVESNKLVFLDLKLEEPTEELVYQNRKIPLSLYADGKYLPLVIISTPKGKVFSGIRVCEPCGSFNFHIVEKKYLQCDACGTRWSIETFQGVSGGCVMYPPPGLVVSTANEVEVSLTSTGLRIQA
jgi:uncharacterized membrane protein